MELTRIDAVFSRIAMVLSLCRNKSSRNVLKLLVIIFVNIKNTGERNSIRGPTPCPRGWGARPCLVGPLELHRPQLQLHIFTFGEKKITEKDSTCFTIRSLRQALNSLGRADVESVRGSGEGNSTTNFMILTTVCE